MSLSENYDAAVKALKMLKRVRRLDGTILVHEGVLLNADTPFKDEQNDSFVREVNSLVSLYRNAKRPLRRSVLGFDGGNVLIFNCQPFILSLFFSDIDRLAAVEASAEDFLKKFAGALEIDPAYGNSVDLADAKEEDPEEVDTEEAESEPKAPAQSLFRRGGMTRTASIAPDEPTEEEAPLPRVISPEIVSAEIYQGPIPAPGGGSRDEGPGLVQYDPNALTAHEVWQSFRARVEGLLCKVLGASQAKRIVERELSAMGVAGDGFLALPQFRPFGQKLIKRVKDRATKKLLETELLSIVADYGE